MNAPKRKARKTSAASIRVPNWLRENSVGIQDEFDELVKEDCDPKEILLACFAVRVAYEHHRSLSQSRADVAGFDRETFHGFVKRTQRVASEVELLLSSPLGRAVVESKGTAAMNGIREEEAFDNLPRRLRELTDTALRIYGKTARRRRPIYDEAVMTLCMYVKAATRKWHDPEVSALIAAATNRNAEGVRNGYDENSHRVWRKEHGVRSE